MRDPVPSIQFNNIAKEPLTADVYSLSGQVVAINRSNQTHLHASGGSAYASVTHQGYASASVSPVNITSTNSVYDDVYILTESGEELFIQLVNWENAGIRQGHYIQAIWLNITGVNPPKATPYLVINNRSLGKIIYNYQGLGDAIRPTKFLEAFTAYRYISTTPEKIFVLIALFIGFITIILLPLVVIVAKGCRNHLEKKLPQIAERELIPKLQPFLLSTMTKKSA